MKSPWKTLQQLDPDREYLAVVTDIPPRRFSSTRRLFRGASAVKKQLSNTPGVVGYSLVARPVRKQYLTLSVWTGEEALAAFARSQAHGEAMRELGPEMAPSTFVRWTISGRDGRPSWREGVRRLDAARTDEPSAA